MQESNQRTLKQVTADDLSFIGKVVKKSLENYNTTWDMTVAAAAMLGVACKGSPGMALYMLDEMDPQPNSLVTDDDVISEFPFGFQGDWEAAWDQFEGGDQRRVFKR